jgi:hypothetical protein
MSLDRLLDPRPGFFEPYEKIEVLSKSLPELLNVTAVIAFGQVGISSQTKVFYSGTKGLHGIPFRLCFFEDKK